MEKSAKTEQPHGVPTADSRGNLDKAGKQSVLAKKEYVKKQKQFREHTCHWPGCEKQVPPAFWGCAPHWFKIPKHLKLKIWNTYKPGQEIGLDPSEEYLNAADEVQNWIKENHLQKD